MSSKPLRVCVVTGSRAEYGAFRWLLRDMKSDVGIELKLIVTGAHWLREFGSTYQEIQKDGFHIDARVYSPLDSNSPVSLAHAIGRWTSGMADALQSLRPDVVLVMGDRYELLSVCSACLLLLIPVAHISGGEITEGAIDEQIRHAVTKMSHLHFATHKRFAKRIRQLGEEPWRICLSGEPSLDAVNRLPLLSTSQLEHLVRLNLAKPTALCTFHPVTLDPNHTLIQAKHLTHALSQSSLQCILTSPNADRGGQSLGTLFKRFARNHPKSIQYIPHLGQQAYFSLMRDARIMIGNSSSGIIEASSYNLPVVNIGDRQKGRLRSPNVIDVDGTSASILRGIRKALAYNRTRSITNPYGNGNASLRIRTFLKRIFREKDRQAILTKRFIDCLNN